MFPKEIVEILQKYQKDYQQTITNISKNIDDIIYYLGLLNDNISSELQYLLSQRNIDGTKEIYQDSITLCKFINSIKPLQINKISETTNTEVSEEITPNIDEFDKYAHVYICCEDVCPKCKVKLTPTTIYYHRVLNGNINHESISGFRCPQSDCGSLYMIDSDMQNFDYANTNIKIHTQRYHKLNMEDEVYVVTDVNKCSANNHYLKDITGIIPIIDPNGTVRFTYVDIVYCKTCKKYIMLKDTYQKISDFLACQVIDETKELTNKLNNTFSNYDTTGSKLSQLGYNVNCVDKLTTEQRKTLLSSIILSKLLTKAEIVGNIDKNISNGRSRIGSKKEWTNAIAKWEHDKEFVKSFDTEKSSDDINIVKVILKFTKR